MSLFTPVSGMIGGSLIGGSAGVLLVMNGDIMGISGILSNTLIHPIQSLKDSAHHWRWVYMASFCLAVNLHLNFLSRETALQDVRSERSDDVPIPSIIGHLVGGFLVGMGTRIQNGCTTGHGICGIARLSPRSLVATVSFTLCSAATRFLVSPLRSWSGVTSFLRTSTLPEHSAAASALVTAVLCLAAMVRPMTITENAKKYTPLQLQQHSQKSVGAAISGLVFALGLAVSGMTKNGKVHDFLCLSGFSQSTFDPTLMAVMGSGILSSWASYQFVKGFSVVNKDKALTCPAALPEGSSFSVPTNRVIDSRLLMGSCIFGMGWGITGICPGPALYAAAAGIVNSIVAWMPAFLVGSATGLQLTNFLFSSSDSKQQQPQQKKKD